MGLEARRDEARRGEARRGEASSMKKLADAPSTMDRGQRPLSGAWPAGLAVRVCPTLTPDSRLQTPWPSTALHHRPIVGAWSVQDSRRHMYRNVASPRVSLWLATSSPLPPPLLYPFFILPPSPGLFPLPNPTLVLDSLPPAPFPFPSPGPGLLPPFFLPPPSSRSPPPFYSFTPTLPLSALLGGNWARLAFRCGWTTLPLLTVA